MALHETRVGFQLDDATDFGGNLANVYTQKIHLEPGKKHTILAVDMFIDTLNVYNEGLEAPPARLVGNVFLSPYPAWDTAQITEFGVSGPMASEPMVLFKSSFQYDYDPNDPASSVGSANLVKLREFPTEVIASGESFDFYSNQLYMTVILTKYDTDTIVSDCHISMLVQLDDKEVNEIEHAMGAYAELKEAQRKRLLMDTASLVGAGGYNYSGQWFPSATYGGIRPERMVTGDLIGQFLGSGADNAEQMNTRAAFQTVDSYARRMQPYDEAFGRDSAISGDPYPDWLRWARSEQFMMQERDVFPSRQVSEITQAVVMV
jgi:hypothetical protein